MTLVENASIVQVPTGDGRSVFVLTFEADLVLHGSGFGFGFGFGNSLSFFKRSIEKLGMCIGLGTIGCLNAIYLASS